MLRDPALSTLTLAPPPDPKDLAATIGDLLSQGPADAFAFEHALADLVRAVRADREALRDALLPIIDAGLAPQFGRGQGRDLPLATPLRQLYTLAVHAVWLPVSARTYGYGGYARDFELVRLIQRLSLPLDRPPGMDRYALRSPADILTLRLAELAARIGEPGPVEPVSTPTDADGWIDADVLVARIAEAESAGWQPWPLDFDQALLRLTEHPAPATVGAAHLLVSPAGRRLAGWLRGGRPTLPSGADLEPKPIADERIRSPRIRPLTSLPDPPRMGKGYAPSTLIHLLRRGWYPPRPLADGSCWTVCWPALLPGRPDLIAIAAAWHPRHPDAHGGSCPTPVLTRLAHATQQQARSRESAPPVPSIPAIHAVHAVPTIPAVRAASGSAYSPDDGSFAAIARALTSRSPAKRADAAQALAALAASGNFDARRFAAALAVFATRTDRQILRSAVPALQHALTLTTPADAQDGTSARAAVANRAAASAIGTAILGWLPAILPPAVDQPLPYTSHLLNLAADALTSARTLRRATRPSPTVHAAIDVLTNLASRPSRSPVSDAAHGLLAVLTQA